MSTDQFELAAAEADPRVRYFERLYLCALREEVYARIVGAGEERRAELRSKRGECWEKLTLAYRDFYEAERSRARLDATDEAALRVFEAGGHRRTLDENERVSEEGNSGGKGAERELERPSATEVEIRRQRREAGFWRHADLYSSADHAGDGRSTTYLGPNYNADPDMKRRLKEWREHELDELERECKEYERERKEREREKWLRDHPDTGEAVEVEARDEFTRRVLGGRTLSLFEDEESKRRAAKWRELEDRTASHDGRSDTYFGDSVRGKWGQTPRE